MSEIELAKDIATAVNRLGGRTYYVGGYVRDYILGLPNKDVDIEIHGISEEALVSLLEEFGTVLTIGKSFGVYNIAGHHLDIALPRTERCNGNLHTSFQVSVDPFLGEEKASKRRDFTMNALMMNVLTNEILDFYHGREDMECHVLRYVDGSTFKEDPLRVLRAAQFASRFQFNVGLDTKMLCRTLSLSALSKERIFEELKKALLLSPKPSVFFETLRSMNQLSLWFPECEALIDVPQNASYHQEKDVWEHTMMVLDEASKVRDQAKEPLAFMLSALCHDFGKAVCTTQKNGVFHAYDHEEAGLPLVERFLSRLTTDRTIKKYVSNMVSLHQKPNQMTTSSVKSTNHLFDKSECPEDLILLSVCDDRGRIPKGRGNQDFLQERLRVYYETMQEPFVMGKDLVMAGLSPNPQFNEALSYAHKMRLAGVPKENALKQTLAFCRKASQKGEQEHE